jgi:transposase-like protein
MSGRVVVRRYSYSFKQHVVTLIESGELSIEQVRKRYDIRGACTIQRWLKHFGQTHLLPQMVRIQMADEVDRIKQLEREKQALESALAQSQMKILTLESLLEQVEADYKIDVKKSTGRKPSRRS